MTVFVVFGANCFGLVWVVSASSVYTYFFLSGENSPLSTHHVINLAKAESDDAASDHRMLFPEM